MQTIEAIYENGTLIFDEPPNLTRARALIIFLDDDIPKTQVKRKQLPVFSMGKVLNTGRGDIYADYLSDRF